MLTAFVEVVNKPCLMVQDANLFISTMEKGKTGKQLLTGLAVQTRKTDMCTCN